MLEFFKLEDITLVDTIIVILTIIAVTMYAYSLILSIKLISKNKK